MDLLLVVETLFSNTWMLLTGVDYPGLDISVAAVLISLYLIVFSIVIIKHFMGGRK